MMTVPGNPDYRSLMAKAVLELDVMESKLRALEQDRREPVAIVGLGCRFPGADSPDGFWRMLDGARHAVAEVPADRWDGSVLFDPNPDVPGKTYSRHAGFIDGVYDFDAQFFNVSPREAASLDPQQRLLLEVSWEALENAGIAPHTLKGTLTGSFIGIGNSDYSRLSSARGLRKIEPYMTTGTASSVAAGRLSYTYGLKGPSMAVDTACSSSLVAVHLACQSLRLGECDLALAGGANCILSPDATVALSKLRMLSPSGLCRTFDEAADGFVRAEGCGIVVLRRLSDAVARRENVLAVIRGSAVNHDGSTSGLTVPSGPSQQAVIKLALERAHVDPGDVTYIEAHGTATSLGDPIEVGALESVFNKDRSAARPLIVGSVKTNIGHAEAAAGVAGLIKVVLLLRNEKIPAHLHFTKPTTHIPWQRLKVTVPVESIAWPEAAGTRRIAGVSAFGFGGTNAHVVVEAAPRASGRFDQDFGSTERPPYLLTLSARSGAALVRLAGAYSDHIERNPTLDIWDICHTSSSGRSHFQHRLAFLAETPDHMRSELRAFAASEQDDSVFSGCEPRPPKPAFVFTGDATQFAGVGRELYETQPTFRRTLERCDRAFCDARGESLLPLLHETAGNLDRTNARAWLFAVQMGLADLWRHWGIEPVAVVGTGVGEYAAACTAGVFSIEDGVKLLGGRELRAQAAAGVAFANPKLTLLSADFGAPKEGEVATSEYWARRVAGSERPDQGVRYIRQQGVDAFIEIGPERTLRGETLGLKAGEGLYASLRPGVSERGQMIESSCQALCERSRHSLAPLRAACQPQGRPATDLSVPAPALSARAGRYGGAIRDGLSRVSSPARKTPALALGRPSVRDVHRPGRGAVPCAASRLRPLLGFGSCVHRNGAGRRRDRARPWNDECQDSQI